MQIKIVIREQEYSVDLSKGIDLSFKINNGVENPKCFNAPNPSFKPLVDGKFVGSTLQGSPVNFYNVFINPHGSTTHTECQGHITKEPKLINECLDQSFFIAHLITVKSSLKKNGDRVIKKSSLKEALRGKLAKCLIVRSDIYERKKGPRDFSGTNPPYFSVASLQYMASMGIDHLLTDLPSVDKEFDGGALAGHKAFWALPGDTRKKSTITELISIPEGIKDGVYLLNLQVANFSMDAAPSRPYIFELNPT